MKVEVVAHCWNYYRLITFQLSSFLLYPPKSVELQSTVFYTPEDERTKEVVDWFANHEAKPENVKIRTWPIERKHLMCRAIGRNLAALATEADFIWFTDADYIFGNACIDTIPKTITDLTKKLYYPRFVHISKTHKLGDKALDELGDDLKIIDIHTKDFQQGKYTRAIGGVQIMPGDLAREVGYCPASTNRKKNRSEHWLPTVEDRTIRLLLQTNGCPIQIPSVYRLRHSRSGRFERGLHI